MQTGAVPLSAAVAVPGPVQALCADVGGSYIKFGLSQGAGQVVETARLPTPVTDWPAFVQALAQLSAGYAPDLPLAMSVAALIDPQTGRSYSANIPCLTGQSLAADLAAALGRPVLVANDADAFAMAEAGVGVGAGHATVFSLILGTGVGGGLVVNGRSLSGPGGMIAEWGHGAITRTRLVLPGGEEIRLLRQPCGCGREGCTDTIGGARGIERLHQQLSGASRSSHQILDGWEAGAPAESRSIAVWLELISEPLAFLYNVLAPGVMPVGGGLAARSRLISALDLAVRARILQPLDRPLVVPGRYYQDGGLVGMSVLAAQQQRTGQDAPPVV